MLGLLKVLFEKLFSNDISHEYIDAIPLEGGVREKRSKVSKQFYKYEVKPDLGYYSSKKLNYLRFKFIGIYSSSLIKKIMIVSAKTSEQESLMKFVKDIDLKHLNMF